MCPWRAPSGERVGHRRVISLILMSNDAAWPVPREAWCKATCLGSLIFCVRKELEIQQPSNTVVFTLVACWALLVAKCFRRPLKTTFDMTTLILAPGGAPRTRFIPLREAPGNHCSWLVTENPSREVATKDHSSSNPRKGNPPDLKILESGTLWGANFAKKIAKHGGHACLEVTRKNFTFVKFFRATSEAKSHYFPSGSLFFPKKWPKPTRKMTFLMSSWPFVALVLRNPWNTYKNSVLERVRLGSKAL